MNDLNYYLNLEYETFTVDVEDESDSGPITYFTTYCEELGRYSCFGQGPTPEDSYHEFMKEKEFFIEYLFIKKLPIPLPNKDGNKTLLS